MKLRAAVLGVTDIPRARKSHSNFPTHSSPTPSSSTWKVPNESSHFPFVYDILKPDGKKQPSLLSVSTPGNRTRDGGFLGGVFARRSSPLRAVYFNTGRNRHQNINIPATNLSSILTSPS